MREATLGVLLAGGLARRMGGGDKSLKRVGGRTILERIVARVGPQCDGLIVNANGDPSRFAFLGLPVVADTVSGHPGPLAGVLAALEYARAERPGVRHVISIATDCPFLPRDLAARLREAARRTGHPLACAVSGGQTHPVIGLFPVALVDDLRRALVEEDLRKIDRWTARHGCAEAEWPIDPVDPFFNANAPDDLAEAERLAAAHPEV